jgi:sulfur carrier protein
MNCTVNGQPRELAPDTTIDQLIEQLGLSGSICAAEVDKKIVPKRERSSFVIQDGQSIEIVTLVGGG